MSKTLLIYDLTDKERCTSMVNAFVAESLAVYYFKGGAFRLSGKDHLKQDPPSFDLVIQHRNDPLPLNPEIKFKRRVWYGGGKQSVAIEPGEEVIYRPILGTTDALSKIEAAQLVKFFFKKGPKPSICHEFPKSARNLETINDFIKYCNQYLESPPKTSRTLKKKISQLIIDVGLNPEYPKNLELIRQLEELSDCPIKKFRNHLNTLKPKLFQSASESSA